MKPIKMGKLITSVIATLLLLAMCGCNAEKRTANKDNRAIERVSAKKSLLNRLKANIDSLYPCIVDTTVKYIKGKTDSLYFIDFQAIDTVNRKRIIDSIGECDLTAAFDAGYNAKKKLVITIHDTLVTTVVNRRELDICNDARVAAVIKAAQQESAKNIYKEDRQVAYGIIALLLVMLVGSNLLWFRFKILKPV